MSVSDYSTVPSENVSINGINVAEGCAPANINDAIRQMMADIAALRDDLIAGSGVYAFIPIGTIMAWGDDNPPANFLRLNGAAVSRTTHAALFAKWGTRYGPGDGSTTFNLPNAAGRALLGAGTGSGLTPRAVGATGGAETHVLTEAEMPAHDHDFSATTSTAGRHAHSGVPLRVDAYRSRGPDFSYYSVDALGGVTAEAGEHNHTVSGDTGTTGNGQAHNNMPPFLALNLVVRAL